MLHQIKNIKKKVFQLLTEKPHLRDDDNKLIANIWNEEIGKDENNKHKSLTTTAFCFLEAIASGTHTSPESIRRIRQKIQEQNEHLRGTSYKNRKLAASEVKRHIKDI